MNQRRSQNKKAKLRSGYKQICLFAILIAAIVVLSGCIVDADRILDDDNGLTIGTGGQPFDAIITATPTATALPLPTPTPTQEINQVDLYNWDFGAPTNPPSNVLSGDLVTPPPQGGGVQTDLTSPTSTPFTGTITSDILRPGSEGTEVMQLQQRLKELGYYTGSVDGKYGTNTSNAVKSFQSANKLQADGVAGITTKEAIYHPSAIHKSNAPAVSAATSTSPTSKPTTKPAVTTKPSTTTNTYTNGKTNIYLQLGSKGPQVGILQNRLIVLGYLSGTADNDFLGTTETAVISFQKNNSIYADGVAGPTTLTKLYSSSAKKASSVAATIGSLKRGMQGGGVRALQQQLKSLGYYTGSIDGDFGVSTEAAVIAFQNDNNLKADGIAGKATQNAIFAGSGGGGSGGGGGTSGGGTKPESFGKSAKTNGYTTIYSSTSNKNTVTALQSVLKSRNYYHGELDGSYGNGTQAAVSSYQQSMGLRVTGMAGPTTQRLLYGSVSESGSYSKLQVGSSGTAVRNLQYTLYELKYYDGDITGKYDESTKNAVMNFQQVNGLSVDGVAGQDTQRRLYSSNAKPSNM